MESQNKTSKKNRMILMNGIVLGMAISSRFLLNLSDAEWAVILNFIVLLAMFMMVVKWIRSYRSLMGWVKISFGQTLAFVVKLFVIGAVFSSMVKWYYFTYVRPELFQSLVNEALLMVKDLYSEDVIEDCRKLLTPFAFAAFSAVTNSLLGFAMAIAEWPMVKREQEQKR